MSDGKTRPTYALRALVIEDLNRVLMLLNLFPGTIGTKFRCVAADCEWWISVDLPVEGPDRLEILARLSDWMTLNDITAFSMVTASRQPLSLRGIGISLGEVVVVMPVIDGGPPLRIKSLGKLKLASPSDEIIALLPRLPRELTVTQRLKVDVMFGIRGRFAAVPLPQE